MKASTLYDTQLRRSLQNDWKKIVYLSFLILLIGGWNARAQELDCTVSLDMSQVNSSNVDYLNNLKPAIESYINDYHWTSDKFQDYERIKFNIQVIINQVDNNYNVKATLVLQSQRPIYNTVSQTPILVLSDDWNFSYRPNRSIVHDEFQYDDIASMLDYYSYLVLGFDYDSFSLMGGTPYFTKAQKVVDLAQGVGAGGGWSSSSGPRSRYTLITNLLNPNYAGIRKYNYIYHRKGLDMFTINAEKARENILQALNILYQTQQNTTENYPFDLIFNTKYKEYVSVFHDAKVDQRLEVYRLLTKMDTGHITEYDKLKGGD